MRRQCQNNAMKRSLASFALFAFLAGCTQFPELDRTQTAALDAAAYPDLVPIEPILARVEEPGADPVAEEAGLEGRLARLRARADRLRGTVLTREEKRRLEQGLR